MPRLPQLLAAGAPDVLRAAQKDLLIVKRLSNRVVDVVKLFSTNHQGMVQEATLASGLLYYGLTTLLDRETVGEEYCDILPLHVDKPASLSRRLAFVGLHILAPHLIRFVIARARRVANDRSEKWLARIEGIMIFLARAHVAVFYLTGSFYEPARRFAGLQYAFTRHADTSMGSPYMVLGVILAAQLVVEAFRAVKEVLADASHQGALLSKANEAEAESVSGQKCVL